ncbi:aminotransferase class I/II-fold pyridoxal phosphate-dependent enzyme [Streptomyces sp. NPDC058297]|uniref:aminotransferase class I/II-fold pyridoxal phosphate-dependent enzyme n=1 Tax=Streptomyces sp. NPDC058297 TaxID=3346433 RepID=UPI0036EC9E52
MATSTPTAAPGEALAQARADWDALVARGLSLDLTRGKPSAEQLDLSDPLLSLPSPGYLTRDGADVRNYAGDRGLPELREIFAPLLQVPAGQLLADGNSSLALMHDCLVQALIDGVPGGTGRWLDEERVVFLCPVPGFDRHFDLCDRFGIEMMPVPMTADGPDMDVVERLAATDPAVKGIWCVPKYSNPDGTVYADETVERLARMTTAASDFRIFWDDAYAVHHLTEEEVVVCDVLAACAGHGNPDRALVFGSTSKITHAGAGVAFFGASPANVDWRLIYGNGRSIGPDKVNQLRHAQFLRNTDGVRAHMAAHRELLRPKFDAVQRIFEAELGGTGLAEWTRPRGGYFVTLTVPDGCAREVVRRCAEAGVRLTPAGAAHPGGDDPADNRIRIAPTFADLPNLEEALHAVALCVRLTGLERAATHT